MEDDLVPADTEHDHRSETAQLDAAQLFAGMNADSIRQQLADAPLQPGVEAFMDQSPYERIRHQTQTSTVQTSE